MLFSLLLAGIAVFLSIPVFSGKGKLMNTDNIKKDKVNVFKKWIRILYALMMVMLLVMAFLNFAEKVAYTQVDIYEFTEDYMGKDEVLHPAGEQHTREEMQEILIPTESYGSLCAASSTMPPYKLVETQHPVNEQYSFVEKVISYKTAHLLNFICFGLCMALFIGLYIFTNIMTDKEAQKKARAAASSPVRPSMPNGAFDFSDYKDEVEVGPDMIDDISQQDPQGDK